MTNTEKSFQCETDFLSAIEANFENAKGQQFRGSTWRMVHDDESDRLRALLAENRIYDREKLKSLPANRRIALFGFERRFLFGKRPTGVAVASVLSPLGHYASSDRGEAPPIGVGELTDHVRRLTRNARTMHLIGVCSPSGFTDEARNARLDTPQVTVVLIEPDGEGGWITNSTAENADPRVLKIFDPEGAKEKVGRVRRAVSERSADLLTGSLSASSLAEKMKLSEEVVRQGFRQASADDPELRVTEKDGEFLLFRGAAAQPQERKSMNVVDRIKQLFSSEGGEAEKINVLAERRAGLARRRDRIYEDIGQLEEKEAKLREEGKAAHASKAQVKERRVAAQLVQLRKDIGRQNTTAAMLNKQLNIINTDIHNLTLIQQGEMASLPSTEELTENAVKAEEMLETLSADADLIGSLETGIEETLTSNEELEVLKEFADDEADQVAESTPQPTAPEAPPAPTRAQAHEPIRPAAEEPPATDADTKSRRADAEPT